MYPTQEELEAMGNDCFHDLGFQYKKFARRVIDWHTEQLRKQEPYAHEFGRSNGDGTFSVHIEKGRPFDACADWKIKPLYAAPVPAPAVPEGWQLVKSPITEEMHVAAAKVLMRAPGVDGLPQRMLDSMLSAAPQAPVINQQAQSEDKKGAARWSKIAALMFIGNVELTQDDDGGYSISVEPVENIAAQSWSGGTPEEAIDAAPDVLKGGG